MEQVLDTYEQPYDERFPVVCFDERPCFLIGETVDALAMQANRPKRENYAYQKNGSCALLACVEPLTGRRLAKVYERRTAAEYTDFLQKIAEAYPEAERIRLVQDNLNTHTFDSFYKHLPAPQANALMSRLEFIYTPKSASWLNMIEIEFSALARQCLNRRIPTMEKLESEVLALVAERDRKRIPITWQFTSQDARKTFAKHYHKINPENMAT